MTAKQAGAEAMLPTCQMCGLKPESVERAVLTQERWHALIRTPDRRRPTEARVAALEEALRALVGSMDGVASVGYNPERHEALAAARALLRGEGQ